MKYKTKLGSNERLDDLPPYFNARLTGTTYIQDTIHIGTKLRNKMLQASGFLLMGRKQVSVAHLKSLINNTSKDKHGLVYTDICPKDRQNYGSLVKVMDSRVIENLKKYVPDSQATQAYLKLCRNVTSAFTDPVLAPLERIERIWESIFFLRIWHSWLIDLVNKTKGRKDYTLQDNFITENAYSCIELNGHSLIQLIIIVRESNNAEHFLPTLYNSQTCEEFFRRIRAMSTANWTRINMSVLEVLHLIG